MAVALAKESHQFFGIYNRLISSRCLHASAITFKNSAAASGRRGKRAGIGWAADVEDIRIRVRTKSKAGERKSKKVSNIVKSRIREKRSTSPLKFNSDTIKSRVSREGRLQAQTSSDVTKRKTRDPRDGKSSLLRLKSSNINLKSEGREKKSVSRKKFRDDATTESKVRERRSIRSPKMKRSGAAEREGKVEAAVMVPRPDREASKKRRRRAPEAVQWSDRTAETMLLYKDGTRKLFYVKQHGYYTCIIPRAYRPYKPLIILIPSGPLSSY
jgi:hypothetical protein